jgi:hypothetical protein
MKTRADLKKKVLLCNGMGHSRHGHSASLGNYLGLMLWIAGSVILVILKIKKHRQILRKKVLLDNGMEHLRHAHSVPLGRSSSSHNLSG